MDIAEILRGHFRPRHDLAIIEVPNPREKTLASGIIVPAGERDDERNTPKAIEGTVVAVGPGRMVGKRFVETLTKVGARVLFEQFAGETLRTNFGASTSTFWWIHEDEILAHIEGAGEVTGVVSAPSLSVVAAA